MEIKAHQIDNIQIAELKSEGLLIYGIEDGQDLVGNIYYNGFDKAIVHQRNITPDFFVLKNKMAGEILQKFSNYRIQLAIIGDFSAYDSQSLKDFIYESNSGKQVCFVPSIEEALKRLA